jgi:SNF family Na+-dependent transporter
MEFQGFDALAFITSNLLYIILIIVIIIIAYWVFAPHKLMLKEKTLQKEQVLTKRESRYGRKL